MSDFQQLQEDWGRELQEKGNISDPIHKNFLRRLQKILRANPETTDIADTAFYIQSEAGFYRFRVLELLTTTGERYQVNFHVFPASQTHIHSHGYEGHSFVLAGELNYANFLPEIFSEIEQQIFQKLFASAFRGRNDPERVKNQVAQELLQLFLGRGKSISFKTKVFAAFIGGGDDDEFGVFTKPHEVNHILQDTGGRFHNLIPQKSGTVMQGGEYKIAGQEAHVVEVKESAETHFITKRPKFAPLSGGEFHYFPEIVPAKGHEIQAVQSPRNLLTQRLLALKI